MVLSESDFDPVTVNSCTEFLAVVDLSMAVWTYEDDVLSAKRSFNPVGQFCEVVRFDVGVTICLLKPPPTRKSGMSAPGVS